MQAAGHSIDVDVLTDPTSCSVTVGQLAALSEACARAEAMLLGHEQTGEECFGGLSGIVYRHSSRLLREMSERIGGRADRLADGLAGYAASMTEVEHLMDEAVAVATPRLTVGGGRIWSPAVQPGPDDTLLGQAWAAWAEAVDHWRAGRSLEQEAGPAWVGVVDRGVVIDDGGVVW
jgi:hypothetical protein